MKAYTAITGLDAAFSAPPVCAQGSDQGAEAGASVFKLMEVSRHKSVDTLCGFERRPDLFPAHAGAGFL